MMSLWCVGLGRMESNRKGGEGKELKEEGSREKCWGKIGSTKLMIMER